MTPTSPTQDLVAAIVAQHLEGVSVAEVAAMAEIRPKYAAAVLARLAAHGRVVRVGRGRYAPDAVAEAVLRTRAEMATVLEAVRAELVAERVAHAHTVRALADTTRALAMLRGAP